MQKLERTPLELATFPPMLQNNLKPEAPPPLKMMAARGMVPAPPEFSVRILYQLHFDVDASVQSEAIKALTEMPPQIMLPSLQHPQPGVVLDWIAELRAGDADIIEAVILNQGTDDLTIAALATTANTKVCDLIANNQVRILRSPVILEQLYMNANARMSTIDKLVDLAQRNEIKLNGLPGLQSALDSGQDLGLGQASEADDGEFGALLQEEIERAADDDLRRAEEDERVKGMTRMERERFERGETEEEEDNRPLHAKFGDLSISQRIRLATTGGRDAVMLAIKDTNRLVYMAAIENPRLQHGDIKKIANNKQVADGVIRKIANTRDWVRHYDIKLALVQNPKTALSDVMGFLPHIRTNDLRSLQRNRNVPQQVARQAKMMVNKRQYG